MDERWHAVVERIVQVLGVQPGDLVHVRDAAGRLDILLEIALAIEVQGATPLIEFVPPTYRQRLWNEVPHAYLAHWDRHRRGWIDQTDRILTLAGADPDWGAVSQEGFRAWERSVYRLSVLEEARDLPASLVAVPTEARAAQLGLSLSALEATLLPALTASAQDLCEQVDRVLDAAQAGKTIAVHSGADHVLHLQRGDRAWHTDVGVDHRVPPDRAASGSNLPAGSIYTTVLEAETEGSLWLPEAGGATDVVLHFCEGRIVRIEAAGGVQALRETLDAHSGEPRRVSHIGLGLNPYLRRPIGWTLVDEHVHGALFVALGENRYMGGENESSLNVDFALPGATLAVDGRAIVIEGQVVDP